MLKRIGSHITYANVMSTLAVFLLLGGTSYAAATGALKKNSVGAAQIRTGAVHSSEIHDHSVLPQDINSSTIKLFRGQAGPQGPAGPAGPAATKYWASVSSAGALQHGTANSGSRAGSAGIYTVGFPDSMANCAPLVTADGSSVPGAYANATVTGTTITVRTFDAAGNAVDVGFYLSADC